MGKKWMVWFTFSFFILMMVSQVASAQQKGPYAGRTLRSATWGGAWQETRQKLAGQMLEKATGAKVEWIPGNPVDHLAKMIAAKGGEPPFDVAEMGGTETAQARELGFTDKIDRSLVPNISKVLPGLVLDDSVACQTTEYVIAYIPSKFKELGLPPPRRLEDLFHPKLADRIALPFIGGSTMGPRFLLSLAIDRGGSINNIKPALDRLKEVKVSYYYRATSELEMRVLSGEIWATYWSVTRPFLHRSAGKDIDWTSVGPGDKKATYHVSSLIIPKGSKNRDLAHLFINYTLSAETQLGMAEWGGVRPITEEGVQKVLASSNVNLRRVAEMPWKDVWVIDFPPEVDIAAKNMGKWLDQFNREVGVK